MIRNVEDAARFRSMELNRGEVRYFYGKPAVLDLEAVAQDKYRIELLPLPPVTNHEFEYKIAYLPGSGLFLLILRAPGKWGPLPRQHPDEKPKMRPDVKILVRFCDLYILGFLDEELNQWRVSKDSGALELKSILNPAEYSKWVSPLPFGSSYENNGMSVEWTKLMLGAQGLNLTYKVLSHNRTRTSAETKHALARISVAGPECIRLRFLGRRVTRLFFQSQSEPADAKDKEPASTQINSWTSGCRDVVAGAQLEGIVEEKIIKEKLDKYEKLVRATGILNHST